MLIALFATGLATAAAAPAPALGGVPILCIEGRVDRGALRRVASSGAKALGTGVADFAPTLADAAVDAAARACRQEHRWSEAEADAAKAFTLALFARAGVLEVLRADGVEEFELDAAFDTLSPAQRAAVADCSELGTSPFLAALRVQGVQLAPAAERRVIAYAALMARIETARRRFVAA